MEKLRLIYYAVVLYLKGIELTINTNILNSMLNNFALSSKSATILSAHVQMLQKKFSYMEKRFISLYVQLSCQQ